MAKIDRFSGNVEAFGTDSLGTERTIFGDTAQSNTLDGNITADFLRGWGIVGVNENPTKQDFNGLAFTLGQLISYLHQRGVPEWNTAQEYYQGSVVTTLAGIYRLKAGGAGSVDPDIDGGVNWERAPTTADVDNAISDHVALDDPHTQYAEIVDLASDEAGSGASLVSMKGGPTVETAVLDRVIRVTSIAEMEAYSVPAGYVFSLSSGGRSGTFDVVSGDFSTELSEDILDGVYVALANNPTATTKVARRRDAFYGYCLPEWFGLTGTSSTHSPALKAANLFLYRNIGGRLILTRPVELSETFEIFPNVHLEGNGLLTDLRITKSFTGGTLIRTTRPAGYVPDLAVNIKISGVSIINDASGTGIDLTLCGYSNVERCEIALGIGISFNKKASQDSEPFNGQSYFNKVSQCKLASCDLGIVFYGASNRNSFELNTYTNCLVAIDFAQPGSVSETNVFTNENIEGCRNAFEWLPDNIFTQTWIGLTVENPSSNGFACPVKDPGRQNFYSLALIPSSDPTAVDFFQVFGALPSVLIGSRGSSEGFSYGIRLSEQVFLYDHIFTDQHGSSTFTGEIISGASSTITIPLAGAGNGDIVLLSANNDLVGGVLTGYATSGQINVRLQNASGGNIVYSDLIISAASIKRF